MSLKTHLLHRPLVVQARFEGLGRQGLVLEGVELELDGLPKLTL